MYKKKAKKVIAINFNLLSKNHAPGRRYDFTKSLRIAENVKKLFSKM